MAINAEEARVVHTANGVATFFSYAPIEGATASNLKVWLFNPTTGVLTAQTLTTHYTFGSGGVTFLTAPANGLRVILRREVPFTQPDIYTTNTPFPAKVTENRLDKIVMALQELKDDVNNRSIQLPLGDAGFSSSALPAKEARKGKVLGFDPTSGDPIVYNLPGVTTTLTTWGAGLIAQPDSVAGRLYMGATAVGDALFTATSDAAARATLGATAVGDALFTATSDAAARTTLGATTTGDALFTAASAAAARTTLGATTVGDALFTATSAAAARTTLGATTVGNALFTATSAAAARSTIGAAASGAITGSGLTVSASPRLLGRYSASSGAVEEITLGTGLSLTGSTLNATAGFPSMSSGRVLGRFSSGTGPAEELEAEIGSDPTMRVAGGILRARRISDGELFIDRFNTSAQGGRITFRRHSDNANTGQLRLWNNASEQRLSYYNLIPSPTEIFAIDNATGRASILGQATADDNVPRYDQVRVSNATATLTGSAVDITGIPSWAYEVIVYVTSGGVTTSARINFRIGTASPLTSGYSQILIDMTASSFSIFSTATDRIPGAVCTSGYSAYVRLLRRGPVWEWSLQSFALNGSTATAAQAIGGINISGHIGIVRIYPEAGTFNAGTATVFWRA